MDVVLPGYSLLPQNTLSNVPLTIPGYNYLGPGNKLDNGEPTNHLDELAKEHDIAYSKAKNSDDINTADLRYGSRFITWGTSQLFNPWNTTEGKIGVITGSVLLAKGIFNTTLNQFGIHNPIPGLNYGHDVSKTGNGSGFNNPFPKKNRRRL